MSSKASQTHQVQRTIVAALQERLQAKAHLRAKVKT
jgi:hypothetical protein